MIPQRPSFVFALDQEPIAAHDGIQYGRRGDEEQLGASYGGGSGAPTPRVSLLRQHLEASPPEFAIRDDSPEPSGPSEAQPLLGHHLGHRPSAGSFHERERKALDNELRRTFSISSSSRGTPSSIFAVPPQLATPDIVGSYGSFRDYGAVSSEASELGRSSMADAGEMWRQQQTSGNVPDGEAPPIFLKEVEQEDGKIVLTVKGQSTLPQTIFNSIK